MKNIVIIVASSLKNLELANHFKTNLESLGAHVDMINIIDLDLPLYSQKSELQYEATSLMGPTLATIQKASGFVFLAPEYNGSTPPSFTNFLAWLSRSSKNWREALNSKVAAIGTFSGGGGVHVLLSMRTQLSFMGMNVLGRQIHTHNSKQLEDSSLQSVCQELIRLA